MAQNEKRTAKDGKESLSPGTETLGKAFMRVLKLYGSILWRIIQPGVEPGQRACGLVGLVPLLVMAFIAILGIVGAATGAPVPFSLLFWLALAGLVGFIVLIPMAVWVTGRPVKPQVSGSWIVPKIKDDAEAFKLLARWVDELRVAARDWLKDRMKGTTIEDYEQQAPVASGPRPKRGG